MMRLLKRDAAGNYELESFAAKARIPPYAILSHTWLRGKNEEPTHQDIINGTGNEKPGYGKLDFCARQAKFDDLDYFWVDTCNINKDSSAELSEAINSMFKWYQSAERCYVYLSDVSVNTQDGQPHLDWLSAFLASRWFSRGWTLQELLAPASVEFYSRDEVRLGDKKSLELQIQQATGISLKALRGHPLSGFGIEERLAWGERRQTTVEEDMVYCLLGIFGVSMPLVYAEGHATAMSRMKRAIEESHCGFELGGCVQTPRVMPFARNRRFVGREAEILKIENLLFRQPTSPRVAITGLGGIGKTQLAVELVYRRAEKCEDCNIFWIPANNLESLHQAYKSIADTLNIPGRAANAVNIYQLVRDSLSNKVKQPWLLVYDNADDIGMWLAPPVVAGSRSLRLLDYVPQGHCGSIIFTSRTRKAAVKLASSNVVELSEMDNADAQELLRKSLIDSSRTDDMAATGKLLTDLTCLPLAIVQAAAYVNENSISIAEYNVLSDARTESTLELLHHSFETTGRYCNAENPIATTWLISFEQIIQRDPRAAEYLSFIACIEGTNIPESILPAAASKQEHLEAIGTLSAYSFVKRQTDHAMIDVHPLVHLVMRNWLLKNDRLSIAKLETLRHLSMIFRSFDLEKSSLESRSTARLYIPHARRLLCSMDGQRTSSLYLDLLDDVGWGLLHNGRYDAAEKCFRESLATRTKFWGRGDEDNVNSMSSLAEALRAKGNYKAAAELKHEALSVASLEFGPDHTLTLVCAEGLALILQELGEYEKAEVMFRSLLKQHERIYGSEHIYTISSVAKLAEMMAALGKEDLALKLHQRALQGRVKILGLYHPRTINSLCHIGFRLVQCGNYYLAEKLLRRALRRRVRVLGLDHPDTFDSYYALGYALQARGDLESAEHLYRHSMSNQERLLGFAHPHTWWSATNLATVWQDLGNLDAAEQLFRRILSTKEAMLGKNDRITLHTICTLAKCLSMRGFFEAACNMYHTACDGYESLYGLQHIISVSCRQQYLKVWKVRNEANENLFGRDLRMIHEES